MNIRDNVFKQMNPQATATASLKVSKGLAYWLKHQINAILALRKQSFIQTVEKNYVFALYITFIGLVYIFNSLHAERQAATVDRLIKENKELKSEYMTLNAKLSLRHRQSEVLGAADSVGLHLLNEPPFKLTGRK
jgi:hypothetical protein